MNRRVIYSLMVKAPPLTPSPFLRKLSLAELGNINPRNQVGYLNAVHISVACYF